MANSAGIGPEFGIRYQLQPPGYNPESLDKTVVWNDPADDENVGVLSSISGIDSPEIRDSYASPVEDWGGVAGTFWWGSRPLVLEGTFAVTSPGERNIKIAQVQGVLQSCFNAEGRLVFTPSVPALEEYEEEEIFLKVRYSSGLRVSGGFVKDFQFGLVASDPRAYSVEEFTGQFQGPTSLVFQTGSSNTPILPRLLIPSVQLTSGSQLTLSWTSAGGPRTMTIEGLSNGDKLELDWARKTAAINDSGSNYAVEFSSSWDGMSNNVLEFSSNWNVSYTAPEDAVLFYRHTWI